MLDNESKFQLSRSSSRIAADRILISTGISMITKSSKRKFSFHNRHLPLPGHCIDPRLYRVHCINYPFVAQNFSRFFDKLVHQTFDFFFLYFDDVYFRDDYSWNVWITLFEIIVSYNIEYNLMWRLFLII